MSKKVYTGLYPDGYKIKTLLEDDGWVTLQIRPGFDKETLHVTISQSTANEVIYALSKALMETQDVQTGYRGRVE